jgi:hypothetical protein
MKIKVQVDGTRAIIHTNHRMPPSITPRNSGNPFAAIFGGRRETPDEEWGEEDEPEKSQLSQDLDGVHGIIHHDFRDYSLFISIGEVFKMTEVLPRVISILCSEFGDHDVDVDDEDVFLVFGESYDDDEEVSLEEYMEACRES